MLEEQEGVYSPAHFKTYLDVSKTIGLSEKR
jgi:hypothetical protein